MWAPCSGGWLGAEGEPGTAGNAGFSSGSREPGQASWQHFSPSWSWLCALQDKSWAPLLVITQSWQLRQLLLIAEPTFPTPNQTLKGAGLLTELSCSSLSLQAKVDVMHSSYPSHTVSRLTLWPQLEWGQYELCTQQCGDWVCHHGGTHSVREWKDGYLPRDVPGYLQLTSGKDAKSFVPPLSYQTQHFCRGMLWSQWVNDSQWQWLSLKQVFGRSISKLIINSPHAHGNGLELQSGGILENISPSSYGTPVRRRHLSNEALMGNNYFLHSAFGQNAASLPAGMNSLQEVTKCMNMILNTSQVDQVVVFLAALTQQAARKQMLIHHGMRPTPESVLMVFLVPYSITLQI